jgi:hypothetical protein
MQSSKSGHNLFAEVDHDRKHIASASSKNRKLHEKQSSVLPDIDLNIRQKLASNDLLVKFSHKSHTLTVASTFSKKNSSSLVTDECGSEVEFRDDDNVSTKSNYSDKLENFKLTLRDLKAVSPISAAGARTTPFSPASASSPLVSDDIHDDPQLNAHANDYLDPWAAINDYDDPENDYIDQQLDRLSVDDPQYSVTDPKLYKSALDAHHSFMNKSKSKNSIKYIKSIGSSKTLPSSEMIEETKKARSSLEVPSSPAQMSPTKSSSKFLSPSSPSNKNLTINTSSPDLLLPLGSSPSTTVASLLSPAKSPSKGNNALKPLTTSFMFLTALTKGKVPKLAKENSETNLQYESSSIAGSPALESKSLSPLPEIMTSHYKAPLDSTNSPVIKPPLSVKTYSRFKGLEDNPTAALRSIKSFETASSSKKQIFPSDGLEPSPSLEENEPKDVYGKFKQLFEDPKNKSLYEIPEILSMKNDKKTILKSMDNMITNLTFIKAPNRPITPEKEKPIVLTLKNVLGDHLMTAASTSTTTNQKKQQKSTSFTEEEYNRLVYGNVNGKQSEGGKENDDDDDPLANPYLTNPHFSSSASQSHPHQQKGRKSSKNSILQNDRKEEKEESSTKMIIKGNQRITNDFQEDIPDLDEMYSSSFQYTSSHPNILPFSNQNQLDTTTSSVKESDRFPFNPFNNAFRRQSSTLSDDSNYSSCTFTDPTESFPSPSSPFHLPYSYYNDPSKLPPPLDLSVLHNHNGNWSTTASIASANGGAGGDGGGGYGAHHYSTLQIDHPPQRRRSFLKLPSIAQNSYGIVRSSFLRNFNRKNNLSSDSVDGAGGGGGGGNSPPPASLHDYTKALSHTTQSFISSIAKQFSRSYDSQAGGGHLIHGNDPLIRPSEDYFQPKYYIMGEEGDEEEEEERNGQESDYDHDKKKESNESGEGGGGGSNDDDDNHSLVSYTKQERKEKKEKEKAAAVAAVSASVPLRQPLSNPNQEFIYQHSTNSYVPKDYINTSTFGYYQRGGTGADHEEHEHAQQQQNSQSSFSSSSSKKKKLQEELFFSDRHLEKISSTTVGNCEPVIYLPPNYQQYQASSLAPYQHHIAHLEAVIDEDETKSVDSHNLLKVYSKNNSSRNNSNKKTTTANNGSRSNSEKPLGLAPGVVIADSNFPNVQHLLSSHDPKDHLHYVHFQHIYEKQNDKEEEGDVMKEEKQDEGDGEGFSHPLVIQSPTTHYQGNLNIHHVPHHVNNVGGAGSLSRHHSNNSIKSHVSTQSQRNHPIISSSSPSLSGSVKTLHPVSSNLDLRDEILNFMKKTNSPLQREYEEHVEKTMSKPSASTGVGSYPSESESIAYQQQQQPQSPADTKRSIATDISMNSEEAQKKLWEKLHTRYSGDREGEYHTKIKLKNYLKESVKEETQIMKKYLEEIEDW